MLLDSLQFHLSNVFTFQILFYLEMFFSFKSFFSQISTAKCWKDFINPLWNEFTFQMYYLQLFFLQMPFSSIVFLKLSNSLLRFLISISLPSLYFIAKDLISLNLLEISSNFFFWFVTFCFKSKYSSMSWIVVINKSLFSPISVRRRQKKTEYQRLHSSKIQSKIW